MADKRSYKNDRNKKNQPQIEQQVVEAIFRGIGALWNALFGKNGKARPGMVSANDAKEIAAHFSELEAMLTSNQLAKLAISEGDKLLDRTMELIGAEGFVFADRLRSLENRFDAALYQEIWSAHKLRNQLAHEMGATLDSHQAKQALAAFRKALRTLGVFV